MSFVDELNRPDEVHLDLDPEKKEKIQSQFVNTVINVIQDTCRKHKDEHFLEGEYVSDLYAGYSNHETPGIEFKPKSKINVKVTEKLIGAYKEPTSSEQQQLNKELREYEYYHNPKELREKLSSEIRKLGFTQFEVELIKQDYYWLQDYMSFWGTFKKREIPKGRYRYTLYIMLKW